MTTLQRYFRAVVKSGKHQYDSSQGVVKVYQDRVGQYLNHRHVQLVGQVVGSRVSNSSRSSSSP